MIAKNPFCLLFLAFFVLSSPSVLAHEKKFDQEERVKIQSFIDAFTVGVESNIDYVGSYPLTEVEQQALLEVLADRDRFHRNVKRAAFKALCSFSSKIEPSYLSYCDAREIRIVKEVPAPIYAEIVQAMTISCVDAFVYNFEKRAYLMIQRTTPPGEGRWWIPGGRIFKGESFYESAVRKTKKESGLAIYPIAQLGTYSTYFSESAWGADVHTDTKNTVVLALCDDQDAAFDEHHQALKWVSIDEPPTDLYILSAYKEATTKLVQMGFID